MFRYLRNQKSFTLTPLDNSASQNRFIGFFKKNPINLSNGVNRTKSFTLIELLIVIAILALLMSIIIITLNPSEMLKKSRDTKRISSLKALNNALGIFQATKPTTSTGTAYIVYISIPDSSSTCANLGLPTLPDGYTYQCSTVANYRKTDGTGWIPVNFNSLDIGSPISSLPIDPTNTTSTGLYFTYVTGSSWEMRAQLESDGQEQAINDGDAFPGLYSVGTTLNLTPAMRDRGLVGYWDFEEGSGTTAYDRSGNSNNGTWGGTGTHYTTGKVGSYAGNFASTTQDYVNCGNNSSLRIDDQISMVAWIKSSSFASYPSIINKYTSTPKGYIMTLYDNSGKIKAFIYPNGSHTTSNAYINLLTWHHIIVTARNGEKIKIYVDGNFKEQGTVTVDLDASTNDLTISGTYGGLSYFDGQIDDVRVYNRALSASEIKAIYEGTK